MPPKGKKNEPSKKTQEKAKEKVIEDKTFGLKNKKGSKQQKFIKTVTQQVKQGNQKASKLEQQQREEREKKKDEKKKLQDELNTLFKPVQSIGKGTDPKSVLCAFFKQGQCSKGDKCKFSHDLAVERKSEKRSVYEDIRSEEDNMDNWDEAKLNEVINKKHGEAEKTKPKTAIICKHFLEAVENSKYGWFWSCPNGDKCIYRHALPPGFVLKKDQKKEEKAEEISLEDLIERERAALGHDVTRITLETFLAWKQRKRKEKIDAMKAEQDKKKADFKAGKMLGISGRQMFEFNPDLMTGDDDDDDDDEAAEAGVYMQEEEDEDDAGPVKEIVLDDITEQASEVDSSGTQAPPDRLQRSGEDGKLDEAAAIASPVDPATQAQIETDAAIAMAVSATVNGDIAADMPIDEDLFAGDDIDLVDEDLETLDLED